MLFSNQESLFISALSWLKVFPVCGKVFCIPLAGGAEEKFLIDDLKENLEYISANTVYVLQASNYLHFPYKILLKESDA